MEQKTLEIVKSNLEAVGWKDFSIEIESAYNGVKESASKNRDKHFSVQNRIIYGSAGASIANVFVTLCGAYESISHVVPLITGISSILSITVTLMLARKSTSKYSETWLRHQTHQSDMEFELMEYAYGNGKYSSGSKDEKAHKFRESIFIIWRKNQERFISNMSNFDKD